jgi:hypothetical protein
MKRPDGPAPQAIISLPRRKQAKQSGAPLVLLGSLAGVLVLLAVGAFVGWKLFAGLKPMGDELVTASSQDSRAARSTNLGNANKGHAQQQRTEHVERGNKGTETSNQHKECTGVRDTTKKGQGPETAVGKDKPTSKGDGHHNKQSDPVPGKPDVGPETTQASNDGPIFFTAATLSSFRKKVAENAPEWRVFKAVLDQNLNVIPRSSYQGAQLGAISNYALGYLLLKDRDPAIAGLYADKAIGYIKSGLHGYQRDGGWATRQFLARGDGKTSIFKLPHDHIVPSSVMVFLGSVATVPIKRAKAGLQDEVAYYRVFLKVSNTKDGPEDYKEGRDWRHNPDLPNNQIDWSLPGKRPSPGATYYVTMTTMADIRPVPHVLNGNTITLAKVPARDQTVFVQYLYGIHAPDGSSLAYQQTSAGDGGFNSIFIDDTYTSRYLGKHIAMGLDWLDGYAGLKPKLRAEIMDMLVRWSDFVRDKGYARNGPDSNYGAGGNVSRVMTALALASRHPAGRRLVSEVIEYRRKHVVPALQGPSPSLKGGFWAEGWNYGQLAAENLLMAGIALEARGLIPEASAERQWAGEVIQHLISAQSSPKSVYDGGDFYAYPAPFPGKLLFYTLSAATVDDKLRAYANYILEHFPAEENHDYMELLFRDRSTPASFWSGLPLQWYASGTGLLTARSDWSNMPTWVAFQLGDLLMTNHETYCPGQLQIRRGPDDLLINGNAPGNNQAGARRSMYGNLIVVDANGDKSVQTYPFSTGYWYGKPGVVMRAYEAGKDYVYCGGDYRAAYSTNTRPGGGGPVTELTREIVYVRPNYVFVYDRVTTLKDTYTKQLRWHFLKAPTVDGQSFKVAVGQSKLFGKTFASLPLKTTAGIVKAGSAKIHQIITQTTAVTKRVRFVSVLEVGASALTGMDSAERIASADDLMEGAKLANAVVLFASNGFGKAPKTFHYRVSGSAPVQHVVADLRPGVNYQVKTNGSLYMSLTATAQGTIAFTTMPKSNQDVEVAEAR